MGDRCLLVNALMGARSIVIFHKFMQNVPKMRGIEDQNMVQAFFSNGTNPSFSEGTCVVRLEGGVDDVETFRLENGIESLAEFGVIVVDQELRR